MGKNLLENIEDGLYEYYISEDLDINGNIVKEDAANYGMNFQKYEKLAKQLLVKAKAKAFQDRTTKVISILEASERLKSQSNYDNNKIISIFNTHVSKYGLAVNYRNLKEMSIDEISEILRHIDYSNLINEIDEELEDE